MHPMKLRQNAMKALDECGNRHIEGLQSSMTPTLWLLAGATSFHDLSDQFGGTLDNWYSELKTIEADRRVIEAMSSVITDAASLSQSIHRVKKAIQTHYGAQLEQERSGVAPIRTGRR